MKILLISSNRLKKPFPVFPLGLCYIASSVENAGYDVKVLDLCFSQNPGQEIRKTILDFSPDLIGISVRNIDTTAVINSYLFIDEIKNTVIEPCKNNFDGPIVLGGTAIGINGMELLEYYNLEYAVYSDGESAFIDFIKNINNDKKLNNVKGLIINNNNCKKINPPAYVKNLDDLPFPKIYKYINLNMYKVYNTPMQVQTKRGCELNCVYCTYNEIEGKKYRLRDPVKIADEIDDIIKHSGIKHIEFVDSTFNIPVNHAKKILKEIKKRKLKLKITAMGINPKGVDEEFAALLKATGFYEVFISVDACADETLKTMRKGFTKDDIFKTAKLLHNKWIPVHWCLLLGAPGETRQTLKETFKTINKASSVWDFIDIGVGIRIYNKSPLIKCGNNKGSDNYLKPVAFIPENIALDKIFKITLFNTLKYHNYFMHEKIVNIPFFYNIIFKIFLPKQPLWKGYVFFRLLSRVFGFSYLTAFIYWLFNKKQLM